jgi:dipeptidyl aminopeptidase/acylaminoacyl peptidase
MMTLAAAAAAGAAWLWAGRMADPRPSDTFHISDYPGLKFEPVTFVSRTGVVLTGRFFPGHGGATVVLTHGYGGSQDEMLPVADLLAHAGFGVLTYDSRGMGGSEGSPTLGRLEQQDLRSAIDYVVSRPDVDTARIGAMGHSTGGATTVLAAAYDDRIRAVVTDAGWSNIRHWLEPSSRDSFKGVTPVADLALRMLEYRADLDMDELRPVEVINRISPRPLLIVHGADDPVVPATDAQENYDAAGSGKELWIIPGAGHGDTVTLKVPGYGARIVSFFEVALSGPSAG